MRYLATYGTGASSSIALPLVDSDERLERVGLPAPLPTASQWPACPTIGDEPDDLSAFCRRLVESGPEEDVATAGRDRASATRGCGLDAGYPAPAHPGRSVDAQG